MKERGLPKHGPQSGRRTWGRAQEREVTDPYKAAGKMREPAVCPQCQAVFRDGRWRWTDRPADAEEHVCPACHRINDKFPAGIITIETTAVPGHKDEILHLVRNAEAAEKREHPLGRIMTIDEEPGRLIVSTTDIHLPRRIGEALERSFQGKAGFDYDDNSYFVRVHWAREA